MTSPLDFLIRNQLHLGSFDSLRNFYVKNWDDYEALGKLSEFDIIGIPAKIRRGQLEAEENHRYWNDWSKNTGVSLDALKYPIRSRIYSNYGFYGNSFNASAYSFAKLYRFSKPKKYTINNYRNNVKYYR